MISAGFSNHKSVLLLSTANEHSQLSGKRVGSAKARGSSAWPAGLNRINVRENVAAGNYAWKTLNTRLFSVASIAVEPMAAACNNAEGNQLSFVKKVPPSTF